MRYMIIDISYVYEVYQIFCTAVATVIILSLLIGIDVEVVPFKYSLKNILEKRYERKNKNEYKEQN